MREREREVGPERPPPPSIRSMHAINACKLYLCKLLCLCKLCSRSHRGAGLCLLASINAIDECQRSIRTGRATEGRARPSRQYRGAGGISRPPRPPRPPQDHTHTHTHARTHAHTRTHARAHTHTRARARAHTHTHTGTVSTATTGAWIAAARSPRCRTPRPCRCLAQAPVMPGCARVGPSRCPTPCCLAPTGLRDHNGRYES